MTDSGDQGPRSARSGLDAMGRLLDRALSAEDLALQTREVAASVEPEQGDLASVLVVEVGGERFGLPGSLVRRVVPPAAVHRIPHRSNSVLRGLCNLGGQLLLTGSLEALMELAPASGSAAATRRMLILADPAGAWAVEVDRVHGVVMVERTQFRDPPATVRAARDRFSDRLFPDPSATGGDRIALLDAERLLQGLARSLA